MLQGSALRIPYFLRREERSKEASTPSKASPLYGEDATAPPVALTLRYPRTIKGPGYIFMFSRKHSWTSQASKARNRTSRSMFSRRETPRKHSARGGIHRMYYYRNLLRFLYRVARQANRHEMLFERSEFIE